MTIIYPSPIFGPIHSRRLGISLGINLLPADGKICSFDCIYCECGFNADHRPHLTLPTRKEVSEALEAKLKEMNIKGQLPDVLTFAGNGEPTMHPDFPQIIEDTLALRNQYAPLAKVSVLSNSTFIHRKDTFEALKRVDNNILKLDTVDLPFIELVDRPNKKLDIPQLIDNLKRFQGKLIIQTMFLKGEFEGVDIDNTGSAFVEPWIAQLKEINPEQVMIYTIDRETPAKGLKKASREELDGIGARLELEGFKVSISY